MGKRKKNGDAASLNNSIHLVLLTAVLSGISISVEMTMIGLFLFFLFQQVTLQPGPVTYYRLPESWPPPFRQPSEDQKPDSGLHS